MLYFIKLLPWAYLLFRFYPNNIIGMLLKPIVVIGVLLYLLCNFSKAHIIKERKSALLGSIIVFMLIISMALIVPIFHGTFDFSYVRKLCSDLFDFACLVAFAIHIKKTSNSDNYLIKYVEAFCAIMTMYIMFSILCMFLPTLRSIVLSWTSLGDMQLMDLRYAKYAGRVGWDGFAGFRATLRCSFGILMCITCFSTVKLNLYNKRKLYFYIIFLLCGNFMYGRTGLIASILMLFIFVLRETFIRGKLKVFLTIASSFILIFVIMLILKSQIPLINSVYNWAFEPVINYVNGKGFTATSLTTLETMYIKPSTLTIWLGDGVYTDPVTGFYYMRTDVGFLRQIYFWGIIPTLIVYLLCISTFCKSFFYKNRYLLVLFIILLAVFEAKGEAYRLLYVSASSVLLFEFENSSFSKFVRKKRKIRIKI